MKEDLKIKLKTIGLNVLEVDNTIKITFEDNSYICYGDKIISIFTNHCEGCLASTGLLDSDFFSKNIFKSFLGNSDKTLYLNAYDKTGKNLESLQIRLNIKSFLFDKDVITYDMILMIFTELIYDIKSVCLEIEEKKVKKMEIIY